MSMKKPVSIDEYIGGFPEETQIALETVRLAIKKAAPEAEERISYSMPAFRLNNANLVYFAGYKGHVGFYALPTSNKEFAEDLKGYKIGKGSVQFPLDKPMPTKLIEKMVKLRVKESREKAAQKRMI
ncbi:MAG: hypothetical protein EOO89_04700 [Pedobacter sp.]|nr:MAG: hypothetical protein EOO89_04700 [Pedobacter sp.]